MQQTQGGKQLSAADKAFLQDLADFYVALSIATASCHDLTHLSAASSAIWSQPAGRSAKGTTLQASWTALLSPDWPACFSDN